MTVPSRLSVVTLGARDVAALRAFYERLGWTTTTPEGDFAAFPLGGAVFCLFDLAHLAAEAGGAAGPRPGPLQGLLPRDQRRRARAGRHRPRRRARRRRHRPRRARRPRLGRPLRLLRRPRGQRLGDRLAPRRRVRRARRPDLAVLSTRAPIRFVAVPDHAPRRRRPPPLHRRQRDRPPRRRGRRRQRRPGPAPARLAAALVRVAPPDPGARRPPPRPRRSTCAASAGPTRRRAATRRRSWRPTCSRVLDALGIDRVKLVGHDWGGWIGFLLCLRAPERFDRFLALGIPHPWQTVGGGWRDLPRFWYQLPIITPGLGYALHRSGLLVRAALRSGVTDGAAFDQTTIASFADNLAEPARARACVQVYRAFVLREFAPAGPRPLLSSAADRPDPPAGRHRRPGDQPVDCSPAGSPTPTRCRSSSSADCGHFIADERPDLVADRGPRPVRLSRAGEPAHRAPAASTLRSRSGERTRGEHDERQTTARARSRPRPRSLGALALAPAAQAAIPSVPDGAGGQIACTVQAGAERRRAPLLGHLHHLRRRPDRRQRRLPARARQRARRRLPDRRRLPRLGRLEARPRPRRPAAVARRRLRRLQHERPRLGQLVRRQPTRSAPCRCAPNGYNHLMDTRYEVRDAQEVFEALADRGTGAGEGLIDPQAIAATGGSYGGGISMALGALRNRQMHARRHPRPLGQRRRQGDADRRRRSPTSRGPTSPTRCSPTAPPSTTSPTRPTSGPNGDRRIGVLEAVVRRRPLRRSAWRPATTRRPAPTPTPT